VTFHPPNSDGVLVEIGHSSDVEAPFDFCFDSETPRHKVHLEPFQMASRDVTCREYIDFMQDGGYSRAQLWLSEGWDTARNQAWQAPLYWERCATDETGWRVFTLRGWHPLSALLDTPVCDVSYLRPTLSRGGDLAVFPRKRNGKWLPAEENYPAICLTVAGCTRLRRREQAFSRSSGIAGSGQQAPTPPIRAINLCRDL
jgi:hypothetical protein